MPMFNYVPDDLQWAGREGYYFYLYILMKVWQNVKIEERVLQIVKK